MNVINAIIAAHRGEIPLDFDQAPQSTSLVAMFSMRSESVYPKVIIAQTSTEAERA